MNKPSKKADAKAAPVPTNPIHALRLADTGLAIPVDLRTIDEVHEHEGAGSGFSRIVIGAISLVMDIGCEFLAELIERHTGRKIKPVLLGEGGAPKEGEGKPTPDAII